MSCRPSLFGAVVLLCFAIACHGYSAFDPKQPHTFFPPNDGPILEQIPAAVGRVTFNFDFYHTTSYSPDRLRRFSHVSHSSQTLTSPIKVGVSHQHIADFFYGIVVWSFWDSATGHLLASTVVMEDVFNVTGQDYQHILAPVVPVFAPSSIAWLVGTDLPKIPATHITSAVTDLYDRWVLEYHNTITGKRSTVNEPINAETSAVPGDLDREVRHTLTMRYCNSQSSMCSLSSPPVPFELRTGTAATAVSDGIAGSGPISLGCPAWMVPYHQALSEDAALLELQLYRQSNNQLIPVLHAVREPLRFPYTVSLPYGKYIGVWQFVDPSDGHTVLFSTVMPYHHPPLHHRSSNPPLPAFPNTLDSWIRGPNPVSIPRPTLSASIQSSFDTWTVQYQNTATRGIYRSVSSLTAVSTPVPTLPTGNYLVTMTFRTSRQDLDSLRSPPFVISINNRDRTTSALPTTPDLHLETGSLPPSFPRGLTPASPSNFGGGNEAGDVGE